MAHFPICHLWHTIQVSAPAVSETTTKTTFVTVTLSRLGGVTEPREWKRAKVQVLSGQEECCVTWKYKGNVWRKMVGVSVTHLNESLINCVMDQHISAQGNPNPQPITLCKWRVCLSCSVYHHETSRVTDTLWGILLFCHFCWSG